MPQFQFLNRPVFSPTSCVLCGATDVPVIDTGVRRDVIGHIYLCCQPDITNPNTGCFEQMAHVLGWVPPHVHQETLDVIANANEENENLATELANAEVPLVINEGDLKHAFEAFLSEHVQAAKPARKPRAAE